MMDKFTPGPWNGSRKHPECDVMYVDAVCEAGFDVEVCTLYRDKEANEANARLIAAAPELLEALEELSDIVQGIIDDPDMTNKSSHVDSFTLQVAEAAIAKARGSNEDAAPEDQEMVAGWGQDNVPGG